MSLIKEVGSHLQRSTEEEGSRSFGSDQYGPAAHRWQGAQLIGELPTQFLQADRCYHDPRYQGEAEDRSWGRGLDRLYEQFLIGALIQTCLAVPPFWAGSNTKGWMIDISLCLVIPLATLPFKPERDSTYTCFTVKLLAMHWW